MHEQRRQRVEELRYLIANGRYEVDAKAVAEAMVEQALNALAEPLPVSVRMGSGDVLEAR
jgi:hypothetical protein